jgi:tetratricopeptide (TPR) repeat protein
MQVAGKLIVALSPSRSGLDANIATFEDLAAHPSFAAQEIREQIVSFAASLVQSTSATDAQKNKIANLAKTEMQKQIASYPQDTREHLQLSYVYRAIGDTENALKEIQTAAALSPKKESIWIELGVTNWDKGDIKATQEDFNTAYALGPQFSDLAVYAAAGDIAAGDLSGADKILLSTFGTTTVDNNVLAVAYYRTKNWQRLIGIELLRVASPSATIDTWSALAAAYYASGNKTAAVKTINDAVARFPEASTSGAAAIKQITAQ